MAKNGSKIDVEVRFSWWLKYIYFPGLKAYARFIHQFVDVDAVPNTESINKVVKLGTKFYINGRKISGK